MEVSDEEAENFSNFLVLFAGMFYGGDERPLANTGVGLENSSQAINSWKRR